MLYFQHNHFPGHKINVTNLFISGDLAEAALEQGPKKLTDIKVGVTGAWNSTLFPRWYFIKDKEGHEITDAEIRGGLDGKILTIHRFLILCVYHEEALL
jgi:hypothetical protein